MLVEKYLNGTRYTLSNEGLAVGDEVYPIARGRSLEDGGWILHEFDYSESCSGFPDEPHVIVDLDYSTYKPYQIRTDHGYGPIEQYFKIIKVEREIEKQKENIAGGLSIFHEWVEVPFELKHELKHER